MSEFNDILNKAKEKTNQELKDQILKLTQITEEEIDEIAPKDIDKAKLKELLEVINDKTKDLEFKKHVLEHMSQTSEVVVKLLEKIL